MGLLNTKAVAERLSISPSGVRKLRDSGRILKPLKLGRSVRWDADELDDWIRQGCPPLEKWKTIKTDVRQK